MSQESSQNLGQNAFVDANQAAREIKAMLTPQPWLDLQKEAAFASEIDTLKALNKKGNANERLQQRFFQIFGQVNRSTIEEPPLEIGDFSSLTYVIVESKGGSEVASYPIIRPVFVFQNLAQLKRFIRCVFGNDHSDGATIPAEVFTDGNYAVTGMIVSSNNKVAIAHEIDHSLDPFIDKRKGVDRLLTECYPFFRTRIVLDTPPGGSPNWNRLEAVLDSYYDDFMLNEEKPMSKDEFKEVLRRLMNSLQFDYNEIGPLESQRKILSSRSLTHYFSKLNLPSK